MAMLDLAPISKFSFLSFVFYDIINQQMLERNVNSLADALADSSREKEPNITDAEINESARNFIEFIRILKLIDDEQKAKL